MNLIIIISCFSAGLIGFIGLLPLLIFSSKFSKYQNIFGNSMVLLRLLSFAVGCLLGDIYFQLWPEAWKNYYFLKIANHNINKPEVYVLIGIISFLVFEKIFSILTQYKIKNHKKANLLPSILPYHKAFKTSQMKVMEPLLAITYLWRMLETLANKIFSIGNDSSDHKCCCPILKPIFESPNNQNKNGIPHDQLSKSGEIEVSQSTLARVSTSNSNLKTATGYLNLLANFIDNITHGIAIAASYSINMKVGVITTCAIMVHEIPHEFGDFAILLNSGFTKWSAIKAQMFTSFGCIVGALIGLAPQLFPAYFIENSIYKMLGFTCGGFIHIAMIKILPEILKNSQSFKENIYHILGIASGLIFMYVVKHLEH